ncbi:MAG: transcription antitermination factor NusB [Candidatus Daviesbacteria bacterium]
MKTPRDKRHLKRIKAVKELFAWEFIKLKGKSSNILVNEIMTALPKIDQEISKAAKEWPISKINRMDLAILRLAIFELIIKKEAPFKVIVDEAVELAKEFGGESSPTFVNGVLGKVIESNKLEKE